MGDLVALVVAESAYVAEDAAELVVVSVPVTFSRPAPPTVSGPARVELPPISRSALPFSETAAVLLTVPLKTVATPGVPAVTGPFRVAAAPELTVSCIPLPPEFRLPPELMFQLPPESIVRIDRVPTAPPLPRASS